MDNNVKAFLDNFYKKVSVKEEQVNKAAWILETTGSKDAADLVATLGSEYKLMFSDEKIYKQLLNFKKEKLDHITSRQIDILIDAFKANMIPQDLLEEISQKEAILSQTYANFRVKINDKKVTENEIRQILETEKSKDIRIKAWEASKEVGNVLAPKIIELVALRNKAAKAVGYNNYFDMMLSLSEMNKEELFKIFKDLKEQTDDSFDKMINEINENLSKKFNVKKEDLGPWAWKDVFSQEDPLKSSKLDEIFSKTDILLKAKSFYENMGYNVDDLIKNSDLYERENKNQHAFCTSIDRKKDVRTLNNIEPSTKWMETVLHEFGHAIYDLNIDENLPWLLRQPTHIFATEAIAILMGRQPYTKEFIQSFCNTSDEKLFKDCQNGLKRRLLIFSRFVFLMTEFENEMYQNPNQNLNKLWWDLYEKYYHLPRPKNRENNADWAAKYHIGLAPVYYYNYLLGEVFASALNAKLLSQTNQNFIWVTSSKDFLNEKMFSLGAYYRWDDLIKNILGESFSTKAWVTECNSIK